jgi:DNA-binding CsgD family transcriptional regulator
MLHRAIFGSLERFIGILIEHYAGKMPMWLAPTQVVVATIVSDADDYAKSWSGSCKAAASAPSSTRRNEKINYKVREHSRPEGAADVRGRQARGRGGHRLGPPGETSRRIAEVLKVSVADVQSMEMRLSAADQSLSAPLGEKGEESWQDFLSDPRPDPEQVVIGMRDAASRSRWLSEALQELSPRERRIICERRLVDEGATLEDLGRALGVSKERVRQLESRALLKLRNAMRARVAAPDELFVEA